MLGICHLLSHAQPHWKEAHIASKRVGWQLPLDSSILLLRPKDGDASSPLRSKRLDSKEVARRPVDISDDRRVCADGGFASVIEGS